jgi:hypothetical protein
MYQTQRDELALSASAKTRNCCGGSARGWRRPTRAAAAWAGSFGFEADHYDLSVAVGERVLLPAARNLKRGALLVTDGFSCREQLAQVARKRALHIAEVLQPPRRHA